MSSKPAIKLNSKSKNTKPVSSQADKPQCTACRSDKRRCTRFTIADSDFCYWHIKDTKYGIYIEPDKPAASAKSTQKKTKIQTLAPAMDAQTDTPSEPPKPKTRGRKRKQEIDPRFTNPEYITMWPEICDGVCVLVDRNDNVYSFNTEQPTFLGVKLLTGKIDKSASPCSGF